MTHPIYFRRLALLAGLALCALSPLPALAQADYPAKPITLIVGYPPGGSTDLTGRTVAAELSKKLGVPVVIENVGGAGGAIGAQKVANAAPDGYTLLVGANNEIAISRLVSSAVKYQTQRLHTDWSDRLATHGAGGLHQKWCEEHRPVPERGEGQPRQVQLRELGGGHGIAPGRRNGQGPGWPVHDAHSLPRRGAAGQRPAGQQHRVRRVRAVQRPAAHQERPGRGAGHDRDKALGRHARHSSAGRKPEAQGLDISSLVCPDGPGQAARARGGQAEESAGRIACRPPSCARSWRTPARPSPR